MFHVPGGYKGLAPLHAACERIDKHVKAGWGQRPANPSACREALQPGLGDEWAANFKYTRN